MKKQFLLGILFLFPCLCNYGQSITSPKLPSKLKKTLADMRYIPGGVFTMGRHSHYMPTAVDTTLLSFIVTERQSVDSFYISNHEVTNSEYREFVKWVEDSIKNGILKNDPNAVLPGRLKADELIYMFSVGKNTYRLNIYPDTAAWKTEFLYSYCEPLAAQYFLHPAYDQYPVVGISYLQATAYCHWKAQCINETIRNAYGINTTLKILCRLPTQVEWEYAALYNPSMQTTVEHSDIYIYPWKGTTILDEKGKYIANFGVIEDANGVCVKSYIDDGGFQTTPSIGYSPNFAGLYNMAGNVSEWTSSIPENRYILNEKGDTIRFDPRDGYTLSYNKAIQFLYNYKYPDETTPGGKQRIIDQATMGVHDAWVIQHYSPGRIVKGGSWCNSLIYLQSGVREVWPENRGSCHIGFRMVMQLSR